MINGIINVYKETGYTSHDVVAKIRGIVHQKKIGHTGTLDPAAEGVLPVCLGKATRVADFLTGEGKTYETVMLLGVDTDTQDTTGTVLRRAEVHCTEDEIQTVLKSFEGDQMQIPPMYSAKKINGRKLYELAREGKTVERKPCPVHFDEIRILSVDMPRVTMRVTCSRGTYIRTLCHDIGEKLGCGACMEHLTRTAVGSFREEDAVTLKRISELAEGGRLREVLQPVDSVFTDLPSCSTLDIADGLAHNGNKIPTGMISNVMQGYLEDTMLRAAREQWEKDREMGAEQNTTSDAEQNATSDMAQNAGSSAVSDAELPFSGQTRLYDSAGTFVGLYRFDEEHNILCPVKIFYDAEAAEAEQQKESLYEAYVNGEEA